MQAAAEINRRAPQLLHPRTARVLETIRYIIHIQIYTGTHTLSNVGGWGWFSHVPVSIDRLLEARFLEIVHILHAYKWTHHNGGIIHHIGLTN